MFQLPHPPHILIPLVLLLISSALELSFISSIVGYLHRSGANKYPFHTIINRQPTILTVDAKPKHLLVNQGHVSNGAAGTALVLICFGGLLVGFLERRSERRARLHGDVEKRPSKLFWAYTVLTILSFLLTTSALISTFLLAHQTSNQSISPLTALASLNTPYPEHEWTPGTWTAALLELDLVQGRDRQYLVHWRGVMEAYEYGLIPLFLLGGVVAGVVGWEFVGQRQRRGVRGNGRQGKMEGFEAKEEVRGGV